MPLLQYLTASVAFVVAASTAQVGAIPINEEAFVRIGGIDQWITIKGDDRANPVVLFLHGGPGNALSPYADGLFAEWEADFTLVQWDQRGSGRTYGRNAPSIATTMTVRRMTEDGIEVAEYLTRHLGKPKIILTGGSWGSILGIHMAHTRPDLFYAYIGSAQMVNWRENLAASYARVLQLAVAAGDQESAAALRSIGSPPWRTLLPQWQTFRRVQQAYQAKIATAPAPPLRISAAYAGASARREYEEAEDASAFQFWTGRQPDPRNPPGALTFSGPITEIDLPSLGTDFGLPIFIVQGEVDLTALPELAKAYFDRINAPRKEFHLVPGTGHEPSIASLDLTREILLERVEPLTRRLQ